MVTRIFIEGYEAEIDGDAGARITKAISDIRSFTAKKTPFTRTVKFPSTPGNNKIFGHICNASRENEHNVGVPNVNYNFTAARSAKCVIYSGSLVAIKGVIRLLSYEKTKRGGFYEATIYGELGGFIAKLGDAFLTGNPTSADDLDFSAYDISDYDETSIAASWANVGTGSGVYMPLIDYGYAKSGTGNKDFQYKTFRPALHLKEYVDKIFSRTGYTYDCPFFLTPFFKSLYIPNNEDALYRLEDVNLLYQVLSGVTFNVTTFPAKVSLPTGTPINFSANIFNYDFTYTGVSTISANVSSVISFSFSGAVSTLLTVSIKKNGVVVYADSGTLNGAGAGGFTFPDTVITLVNGDVLNLNLDISPATPVPSFQVTYANLDVNAVGGRMVPALRNEAVPINSSIPKKVKQTDLLDSIIKMFNLHIVEDRDLEKVLVIRPFVQFYSATRRDWTSRVDRGQPYKITPLSELTCKRFNFKYDSDSDYYNEAYRNRNGGNYGDKVLPISYEFGENEKDVKLLFAGSPIVAGSGVVKPVTTIIKLNGSAEEPVASKLRILYGKIVSVPGHSWDIKDGATTLSTISNTYPYAGHLDDPFNPTLDLNFGPPREVFFTLNVPYPGNNLYTAYWEHFIKEIVNKDSHLLTCYVYLTPQDFYTVNFSEYVYIDGALYVLNKIIDFDTENRVPTKVEFLKVIKPLA